MGENAAGKDGVGPAAGDRRVGGGSGSGVSGSYGMVPCVFFHCSTVPMVCEASFVHLGRRPSGYKPYGGILRVEVVFEADHVVQVDASRTALRAQGYEHGTGGERLD